MLHLCKICETFRFASKDIPDSITFIHIYVYSHLLYVAAFTPFPKKRAVLPIGSTQKALFPGRIMERVEMEMVKLFFDRSCSYSLNNIFLKESKHDNQGEECHR